MNERKSRCCRMGRRFKKQCKDIGKTSDIAKEQNKRIRPILLALGIRKLCFKSLSRIDDVFIYVIHKFTNVFGQVL